MPFPDVNLPFGQTAKFVPEFLRNIRQDTGTFEGSVPAGQPVKPDAAGAMVRAESGDVFCGVSFGCAEDGLMTVHLGGYIELPYSGDAPEPGYATLAADGQGGVTADEAGREYLILSVDEDNSAVGFVLR